ncbi:MAG: ComEC/Rec2 family competence protein [Actinobacteria bacterium]|nr:ComEC/Rec2 family competence protein [Actinomycetota bacterium]MBW3641893.1 ComEC/Rec2 family competence protein [Actinomycetota bacterium]
MSDRAAVALALAVCAGAWWSGDVPLVPAALGMAVALLVRRPMLLVAGAALVAAGLGHRAWDGLTPPAPADLVGQEVVLLSDPADVGGALRLDVGVGGRRVEAWARGAPAAALRSRLAGERVVVEGRLRPPPPDRRRWLALRHVSARMNVDEVTAWRRGSLATRVANGLRRTLVQGAATLERDRRALLTGFVLGDDRDQSTAVADDFKAAGLTHLLAVSGQNVAFVLVLCRPALRRLGLAGRWAASLAVISFFGLLTRWEPSVLRASAMAALAVTAVGLGRPTSRGRLLALAVAAVVLLDPLLVHSVGFRLSVGASAGILVLATPLARRLPGPRWLAEAVAVTLGAQVGVAPVLVPVFGGLPVASVPANLLAVPAAGPLMAWGLTAGLAAGVVGPPADAVLHLPTSWLLAWVAGVARWAATLPLGQLGLAHLGAAGAIVAVAAVGARWRRRVALPVGVAGVTLAVLAPALLPSTGALSAATPAAGARLWREGGVVLVLDDADGARLLEGLRRHAVRRLDVVVVTRGTKAQAATVALLRSRVDVGAVLAPRGHLIRGALVPAEGTVDVGGLRVVVAATEPALQAEVQAGPTS